jgi:catechol 2,3-dioxygenase-like lactoylglutathione lyase family enzyme
MIRGIHHTALAVSDIPRACSFYETVLGFEPVGPDDHENTVETATYYWLDIGGGEWLNLAHRPDAVPDPELDDPPGKLDDPHLAFRVTDEERARVEDRLRERGVPFHESTTSMYLRDPDGNLLELTTWAGPD